MMSRLVGASLLVCAALLVSCGDGGGLPDAREIDAPPPGGTFSLSWTIADNGTALSCTDVGGITVSVAVVPNGSQFGFTEVFTCGSGAGTSRTFTPGSYDFIVSLNAAGAGVDLDVAERIDNVEITSGADSPLGAIAFEVLARGAISFRLHAEAFYNCDSEGLGGAAIETFAIELRDSGGTCIPTVFEIGEGSLPATSYDSDCVSNHTTPCIARDQTITATMLGSGPRRLVSVGTVAGNGCWKGNTMIQVPANDAVKALGDLPVGYDSAAPGCMTIDAGP